MTATDLTRSQLNPAEIQTTTNCIGSCESLCLPLPGLDCTGPLSKKAHFPLWIGMICLLRQEALSPVPPSSLPRSLCGDCSGAGKLCMLELFFCEGEMLQLVWFAIMLSFVTIPRWKEMSGIFLAKKKKKSQVQERIQRRMLACFTLERRKTNHTLQCPHPQSKNHLYKHIGIL